ncbi:hypothetical protein HDU96_006040 [Phlyctochytrium bullatum]|nr:hypothetical protein HDU96_006040 [Phlyctochytrium bullatum]
MPPKPTPTTSSPVPSKQAVKRINKLLAVANAAPDDDTHDHGATCDSCLAQLASTQLRIATANAETRKFAQSKLDRLNNEVAVLKGMVERRAAADEARWARVEAKLEVVVEAMRRVEGQVGRGQGRVVTVVEASGMSRGRDRKGNEENCSAF